MAKEIVKCFECNKELVKIYITFFTDQKGRRRYGAICKSCVKIVKKREVSK